MICIRYFLLISCCIIMMPTNAIQPAPQLITNTSNKLTPAELQQTMELLQQELIKAIEINDQTTIKSILETIKKQLQNNGEATVRIQLHKIKELKYHDLDKLKIVTGVLSSVALSVPLAIIMWKVAFGYLTNGIAGILDLGMVRRFIHE